jgi:hypothetical protein
VLSPFLSCAQSVKEVENKCPGDSCYSAMHFAWCSSPDLNKVVEMRDSKISL